MGFASKIQHIYETKYKAFLLITLLLIPAAFGVLFYEKATTGDYFHKGISLKGGESYTIPVDHDIDITALQHQLSIAHPEGEISVRGTSELGHTTQIIVEVSDIDEKALLQSIRDSGIPVIEGHYSHESIGSALGAAFFKQTIIALIAAFILMAIVVFITFRHALASFFVILAVFSTTVETLAVVSLLNIPLSTAGIAALLMLIGYSVDTDILLTNRVLRKQEGFVMSRVYSALKTGMTMTLTALVTTAVAFVFSQSDVIKQIMLILTIGLVFDILNTWIQNVGILRLYLERKKHE